MHIAKESIDSNKIEGTKTEIDDLFLDDDVFGDNVKNDIEEVKNYIKSINHGIESLEKLPIATRLIKECHGILLQGVRGEHKTPGEFRKSQNWIGGATIDDAHFVPPDFSFINELMGDLENFLHFNKCPDLIKVGLAHYQFETIHPFLDGNGRIGRLLIILFLIYTKKLAYPVLYLSQFFEQNKSYYYQNLDITRTDHNYDKWLKFFLVGVIQTSTNNLHVLQKIVSLKSRVEQSLFTFGKKAENAKIVLDHLFSYPIVNVEQIQKLLDCSRSTANLLVADFENAGILKQKTQYKRNRVFAFQEYLDLFESNTKIKS
jgi:Fic family protein